VNVEAAEPDGSRRPWPGCDWRSGQAGRVLGWRPGNHPSVGWRLARASAAV